MPTTSLAERVEIPQRYVAMINTWNRVAIPTRATPGQYTPGQFS